MTSPEFLCGPFHLAILFGGVEQFTDLVRSDLETAICRISQWQTELDPPSYAIHAVTVCLTHANVGTQAASASLLLVNLCKSAKDFFYAFRLLRESCSGKSVTRRIRRFVQQYFDGMAHNESAERQMTQCQRAHGYSWSDVLRLCHPKPVTDEMRVLFSWACNHQKGKLGDAGCLTAMETLARIAEKLLAVDNCASRACYGAAAADVVKTWRLTHAHVQSPQLLQSPLVQRQLHLVSSSESKYSLVSEFLNQGNTYCFLFNDKKVFQRYVDTFRNGWRTASLLLQLKCLGALGRVETDVRFDYNSERAGKVALLRELVSEGIYASFMEAPVRSNNNILIAVDVDKCGGIGEVRPHHGALTLARALTRGNSGVSETILLRDNVVTVVPREVVRGDLLSLFEYAEGDNSAVFGCTDPMSYAGQSPTEWDVIVVITTQDPDALSWRMLDDFSRYTASRNCELRVGTFASKIYPRLLSET